MKAILLALCLIWPTSSAMARPVDNLLEAARLRTQADVRYDPKYVSLSYPGGDVPADTGVCTDVIIRSFRKAYGFDFQMAVHEDMKKSFSAYPKIWGLERPDKNIDHRRVPNLETYLSRHGTEVPLSKNASDYKAGDIVTWRLSTPYWYRLR